MVPDPFEKHRSARTLESGGQRPLRVVLVAGEVSGDNLGAHLIEAIRARVPDAEFAGIAGPRMQAAGCVAWESAERLAVMGLFEVLGHLPRLMRIRRQLLARVLADPPDVFVGIDYQEFNLGVAARLKAAGIRTVQYVSPQVWAWRQGRVRTIGRAVDLILCLLPFEAQFYAEHAVKACFVGHPLADQIPFELDPLEARRALGLPPTGPYIALLPGSRHSEVSRLADDFAATVAWLKQRRADLRFIAAAANAGVRRELVVALEKAGVGDHVTVIDGQSQRVLAASDAVLLASGTATLETSLVKRPMVVVYRLSALTTAIVKRFNLIKSQFIAQPNLLAGRALVPEFVNEQVRADVLGPALLEQLERPDRAELLAAFAEIHRTLRRDASAQAAAAILELLQGSTVSTKQTAQSVNGR